MRSHALRIDRRSSSRFLNWRSDSVVSYIDATGKEISGVAVVIHSKDGKRYYRVRVASAGSDTGTSDWASNLPWLLGRGPHECTCGECYGLFRSTDLRAALCPTCLDDQRPNDLTEQDVFTNLGKPAPRKLRMKAVAR